jgi:membrane protein required for beta-lactamase induction
MLSLFPELLFLSPFAALLIRISISFGLLAICREHILRRTSYFLWLGILEAVFAVALFIGLYTQAIALAVTTLFVAMLLMPSIRAMPLSTIALLIVMCITLLVTGPGPFAMDLPL